MDQRLSNPYAGSEKETGARLSGRSDKQEPGASRVTSSARRTRREPARQRAVSNCCPHRRRPSLLSPGAVTFGIDSLGVAVILRLESSRCAIAVLLGTVPASQQLGICVAAARRQHV